MKPDLTIIGGGLAGCEAAWQAAQRGLTVELHEMRPVVSTGAHQTDRLAELVCSGSLKSLQTASASGLLNAEMGLLDSLILACGHGAAIPGGQALAVDRDEFSGQVTSAIANHPAITLVRDEVAQVPPAGLTIVASGPLTSPSLAGSLAEVLGGRQLSFFDAIAPTVELDSLDQGILFRASRYDKGTADYLNAAMNRAEYETFWSALVGAERFVPKHAEDTCYFEGCLPLEVIAERGPDAPRFGPLKPVGLTDPRTGRRPWAVVQLRQENRAGNLYSLVGCQTQLRRPEQQRVFGLIPGLAGAEYVRWGQVHRNTFLDSPRLLDSTLQARGRPGLFVAGQLTGVEGYVESAAAGWLAGVNAARAASGRALVTPPTTSMIGALMAHITDPWVERFQPMNANFGLLPHIDLKSKPERKAAYAARALADLQVWRASLD